MRNLFRTFIDNLHIFAISFAVVALGIGALGPVANAPSSTSSKKSQHVVELSTTPSKGASSQADSTNISGSSNASGGSSGGQNPAGPSTSMTDPGPDDTSTGLPPYAPPAAAPPAQLQPQPPTTQPCTGCTTTESGLKPITCPNDCVQPPVSGCGICGSGGHPGVMCPMYCVDSTN